MSVSLFDYFSRQVLRLVRSAAAPCRRLLIDYHILKLLYSWMSLKEDMSETETVKHRMEVRNLIIIFYSWMSLKEVRQKLSSIE